MLVRVEPTATQAVAEVHEMPSSSLNGVAGVDSTVHVAPFRDSASVAASPLMMENPTATQEVAEAQDTAFRRAAEADGGLTGDEMDQVDPFQTSARGMLCPLLEKDPTAVQASAAVQDTPSSELLVNPSGSGVGLTIHVLPFHTSASDCCPLASLYRPTAVQAVAVAHDTELRTTVEEPGGLTVGTFDHAVPFHRCASVAVTR
jgi:hypothetical protein